MRRAMVGLLVALMSVESARAQGAVPNGVFVRQSDGTIWLILDGQRVRVPIWEASEPEIAAVPASDQWAVMNESGTISPGGRPAWLADTAPSLPPQSAVGASRSAATNASPELEAHRIISFKNSIGNLIVQGFIKNTGQAPAGSLDVAVSILDAAGSTVGSGSGSTALSIIPAGSEVPFSAHVGNVSDFKDIRVQVQGKAPTAFDRYHQDWRIEGASVTVPSGGLSWPKINGQVVNTGTSAAALVRITAAILSTDGELLEVRDSFAKLDEIAPSQSSPFEIELIGGRGLKSIPRYELWVEGRPR